MTLIFDPDWLDWNSDRKEITKLEAKEVAGSLTQGATNKLAGLRALSAKRQEGAIFLGAFNQHSVEAALFRACHRFNSSPDAKQLLDDATGKTKQLITIKQGTHQPEDVDSGGYMLHFDAHSSRNGKTFHLYIGQLKSGAMTITSIAYQPSKDVTTVFQPDFPETV
jgi:hypothetical protein